MENLEENLRGNKWQKFLIESGSKDHNVTRHDVDQLKKLAESDELIPTGTLPKVFLLSLIACDNDKDKSLRALHNYYKMKREMPEFFANRDVESREFQETLAYQRFAVLPPTPENFIAIMVKLSNFEPCNFNFDEGFKAFLTIIGEFFVSYKIFLIEI
jgi:hypothetical protein